MHRRLVDGLLDRRRSSAHLFVCGAREGRRNAGDNSPAKGEAICDREEVAEESIAHVAAGKGVRAKW